MNYFINKEARAVKARQHTEEMKKYPTGKGFVYDDRVTESVICKVKKTPDVMFMQAGVDQAIKYAAELPDGSYNSYPRRHIFVLNFASYKNPGGMFINGSSAQEESLCHISNLYNNLVQETEYYDWNNQNKNRGLYLNRALVHQGVFFEIPGCKFPSIQCNVITCAAPNVKASKRYQGCTAEEAVKYIYDRVDFLYRICSGFNIDVLILGAWGCGVFGCDPTVVAHAFKEKFALLPDHRGVNWNTLIIHPIPDDKNFNAFKEVYDAGMGIG